jgi:hypothetical protein
MRFKTLIKRNLIIEIISGLFILLYIYTAVSKLNQLETFESVISRSPLIEGKAHFTARAIPIVEILVSLLLFLPFTRLLGLYSSLALMVAFTAYLAYIIKFAPHLPCSCGGVIGSLTWQQHLVFNVFFTLLAIIGVWLYLAKRRQLKNHLS